jgi:hypothetical protein
VPGIGIPPPLEMESDQSKRLERLRERAASNRVARGRFPLVSHGTLAVSGSQDSGPGHVGRYRLGQSFP